MFSPADQHRIKRVKLLLSQCDVLKLAEHEAAAGLMTVDQLLSCRRFTSIKEARWRFWSRLRELGWSYLRVAEVCEVDHSTVIHAMQQSARRQADQLRNVI